VESKSKAQLSESVVVESDKEAKPTSTEDASLLPQTTSQQEAEKAVPKSVSNGKSVKIKLVQDDSSDKHVSTAKLTRVNDEAAEMHLTKDKPKIQEEIAALVQKAPSLKAKSDRRSSKKVSSKSESSPAPADLKNRVKPKHKAVANKAKSYGTTLYPGEQTLRWTQEHSACRYARCCYQSGREILPKCRSFRG
jgi:hypothetical protein